MSRTAQQIEALLRERGHSLTPQRRAIVRHLVERGGHWTASEVLEGITGEFPMASRATVYTTLALLRELGALTEVPGPNAELRYDANTDPHQHFVCRECGELRDVPSDWLPVQLRADVDAGFTVEQFRIVAEGVCDACGPSAPAD